MYGSVPHCIVGDVSALKKKTRSVRYSYWVIKKVRNMLFVTGIVFECLQLRRTGKGGRNAPDEVIEARTSNVAVIRKSMFM